MAVAGVKSLSLPKLRPRRAMEKATKNQAVYGPYTIVIKLGTRFIHSILETRASYTFAYTFAGTSSIIHETTHQPLLSLLSSIVETVVSLRSQGHKVVLVSSGAIGVGMKRMGLLARPKGLAAVQVGALERFRALLISLQALAAIGQGRLIALWDNLFGQLGQPIAQVLLTRGDLSDVCSLPYSGVLQYLTHCREHDTSTP